MYIHALEMSPVPQRALKAADMLRGFAPDAGHLEHMPAHIYVLPDYAQSSSGPLSVEKSDPLGQKATAEPVRKRNQTPGGTPDLRGTAAVFLQHELRT